MLHNYYNIKYNIKWQKTSQLHTVRQAKLNSQLYFSFAFVCFACKCLYSYRKQTGRKEALGYRPSIPIARPLQQAWKVARS